MIDYKVQFFSNTSGGTHCFQAVIKMVLRYFFPKENYTFKKLDIKTAKVKGLWTWSMPGLLWLKKKGFEIEVIEMFDYKEFIKKGEAYLIDFYGKEVGEAQITHSKISNEIINAKKFIKEIKPKHRIPDIKDIINYLNKGCLVVCVVNSRILNNKSGYSGHFVLIKGYKNNSLILHDPGGRPGKENRNVSFKLFEKSWAYPNENAKNIISFKLNK